MLPMPEEIIKLLLSLLCGGLIGIERQLRDKAAGFRTVIFICLGATLFTMLSLDFTVQSDPARIAAQIVVGVGFLGTGAILQDGGRVTGLTTASIVWLSAAVGMAIGTGQYFLGGAVTVLTLLVLWIFPVIEVWMASLMETRTYEVVCSTTGDGLKEIERLFAESGLTVDSTHRTRQGEGIILSVRVHGSPKKHYTLVEKLMSSTYVKEYTF